MVPGPSCSKLGQLKPRVSARFEFRFESLKSIVVWILFVQKLMMGSSKNNRENYPRKCFWTQEKDTWVKFNPGLSTNQPSNKWAQKYRKYLYEWIKSLVGQQGGFKLKRKRCVKSAISNHGFQLVSMKIISHLVLYCYVLLMVFIVCLGSIKDIVFIIVSCASLFSQIFFTFWLC